MQMQCPAQPSVAEQIATDATIATSRRTTTATEIAMLIQNPVSSQSGVLTL